MISQEAGHAFEAGEQEYHAHQQQDVHRSHVLQDHFGQVVEARGYTEVKGEVRVEEGEELHVFVLAASLQHEVDGLGEEKESVYDGGGTYVEEDDDED